MSLSPPMTDSSAPIDPKTAAPRVHLGYLDSLRALAALYVVIGHAALISLPGTGGLHGLGLLLVGPFRYGEWAVDLFIVLSGFCLIVLKPWGLPQRSQSPGRTKPHLHGGHAHAMERLLSILVLAPLEKIALY